MDLCVRHEIKGTVIVAYEGINGTVAGAKHSIDEFKRFLDESDNFFGAEYKESVSAIAPFKKLKVKIKPEIVTMGLPHIDVGKNSGTYVNSWEWNELISDPDVLVLDVRNDFEVHMGSFDNAINPNTKTFRDFSTFVDNNLSPTKHQKIAMSCTGGIRCEKASAFMKERGFLHVFHLKGGVLQYLKDMPEAGSLWRGDCFVFDARKIG
jgi:UPF0176 protein